MVKTKTTDLMHAKWFHVSWDSELLDYPVFQIQEFSIYGDGADSDVNDFFLECLEDKPGLISIRIEHEKLKESMALEALGFKFIEMVHYPYLDDIQNLDISISDELIINRASHRDVDEVKNIALHVFSNERFHLDPRISNSIANKRYSNWVSNTLNHKSQELYVIKHNGILVAFFIIEKKSDGVCYWHLNGISPNNQGKGYGKLSWLAMIQHAKDDGCKRIETCIASRNIKVMNLYSRLGFRFAAPKMTFHWMKDNVMDDI